ncbi:R3H domain [uncultured Ruminococcus sp.]|uniref:RNA-binding cell elongation regulator Jag/EloR n=1 Tax=Massiliimalia timonensis TaxID=1987501 RepID=UPI0008214EC8|nr:RNA-binding cell elongation regulator Jag/EloR [Massiliimalia timonensis]SCI02642.1 R3H domain [uncultured Clostridium sp.]SCI15490.1 R3H domain [uncultured Ruminococcus sp.]
MMNEVITSAKTIEEAVEKACEQLGVSKDNCDVQILQQPKKSLFGIIKTEAQVKVTVKNVSAAETKAAVIQEDKQAPANKDNREAKVAAAVAYLTEVLSKMGLDVTIEQEMKEDSAVLTLVGENLGILIGRHGETLDSLQYLTSLVCNRVEGSYFRVTLDCGNYREKREEALKELAKKISVKVKRTGRSQTLEPMNPYERRIIHAVLTDIEGVTSKSKGEEPNRRVVVISTSKKRSNYSGGGNRGRSSYQKRKPEKTMEEILKAERSEAEQKAKLYSKIEL